MSVCWLGKAQARILTTLFLTVLIAVLMVGGNPARALLTSINGGAQVYAGQSFTVVGKLGIAGEEAYVSSGYGCSVGSIIDGPVFATTPTFHYNFLVPGQPAGPYSVFDQDSGCTNFNIDPTPSSHVPPVTIGGTLLPINGLQVLLPWIALITILGTVSVWTLAVKRRR
jgi:hypothetical protein